MKAIIRTKNTTVIVTVKQHYDYTSKCQMLKMTSRKNRTYIGAIKRRLSFELILTHLRGFGVSVVYNNSQFVNRTLKN